jgi:NAD(P)-dependent dehydrogenase (short-subunit alcohol dehydrogenase family)
MSAAPPLTGKVAVVTGASSGIGLATACLLADNGAGVHAPARRGQTMAEGAGDERIRGGRVVPHPVDVSDGEAVVQVIEDIGAEGAIDILIAAPGTNLPERALGELTPASWAELIGVNLSGAFYSLRQAELVMLPTYQAPGRQ